MTLGFKDQFIPFLQDGSKTHTVRGGARWKVGMRADLFKNLRQKGMTLIFRAMVVKVQDIEITPSDSRHPDLLLRVTIDGQRLFTDETESFFWRDGFRAEGVMPSEQAWLHWRQALPFKGQIIHWKFEDRFMDKPEKPGQRLLKASRDLVKGLGAVATIARAATKPTRGEQICRNRGFHDDQEFIDPRSGGFTRCKTCGRDVDREGLGD